MKRIFISLAFLCSITSTYAAKTFKLANVRLLNTANEKLLEREELTLQLDDQNNINKIYIKGYPISVSLKKLQTKGTVKQLRVKILGLEVINLTSNNFNLKSGGKMNMSFNAVPGAYDNYNMILKYNSGHGKWMLYHNGRIVTRVVARLDIEPGTSILQILNSNPKVEHSYIVY
jgi:hypothetical protein